MQSTHFAHHATNAQLLRVCSMIHHMLSTYIFASEIISGLARQLAGPFISGGRLLREFCSEYGDVRVPPTRVSHQILQVSAQSTARAADSVTQTPKEPRATLTRLACIMNTSGSCFDWCCGMGTQGPWHQRNITVRGGDATCAVNLRKDKQHSKRNCNPPKPTCIIARAGE